MINNNYFLSRFKHTEKFRYKQLFNEKNSKE